MKLINVWAIYLQVFIQRQTRNSISPTSLVRQVRKVYPKYIILHGKISKQVGRYHIIILSALWQVLTCHIFFSYPLSTKGLNIMNSKINLFKRSLLSTQFASSHLPARTPLSKEKKTEMRGVYDNTVVFIKRQGDFSQYGIFCRYRTLIPLSNKLYSLHKKGMTFEIQLTQKTSKI